MRTVLVVFIASLAMVLAGCGSTITPDGAAQSVVDIVSKQTGFKPNDVKCPSGVDAEVGRADRVRVQRRGWGLLGPRRADSTDCDQRDRDQACTQSTHEPPKPTRVQGLRSCSRNLSYPSGRAASPSSDRAITRRWISDVPS